MTKNKAVRIGTTSDGGRILYYVSGNFDGIFVAPDEKETIIDLKNFLFTRQDVAPLKDTERQRQIWEELMKPTVIYKNPRKPADKEKSSTLMKT